MHEAATPCGIGAEIAAIVGEKVFTSLKAPVRRITQDAPAAASWVLEQAGVPQAKTIVRAAIEPVDAQIADIA
ncbi:transketolase C-terminal domain-containing protein [Rhizobacter sp. OV335]|uniref:transketolase C-terminal domain-containing protein n=1 Tax=Rhizobacter sp. OV335 TaxID=1500264 RepID=UPI00190EF5AA|nr:transketolase C-terminal domain-containing protein [Rhizobacter sp. OV335]